MLRGAVCAVWSGGVVCAVRCGGVVCLCCVVWCGVVCGVVCGAVWRGGETLFSEAPGP